MIRKIVKFRKALEESFGIFMERANSFIKHLLIDEDREPWDYSYHLEVYKWAGTLVKIQICDVSRFGACVSNHKDWVRVQVIARQNGGRQLHGRYFKHGGGEGPSSNIWVLVGNPDQLILMSGWRVLAILYSGEH